MGPPREGTENRTQGPQNWWAIFAISHPTFLKGIAILLWQLHTYLPCILPCILSMSILLHSPQHYSFVFMASSLFVFFFCNLVSPINTACSDLWRHQACTWRTGWHAGETLRHTKYWDIIYTQLLCVQFNGFYSITISIFKNYAFIIIVCSWWVYECGHLCRPQCLRADPRTTFWGGFSLLPSVGPRDPTQLPGLSVSTLAFWTISPTPAIEIF